MFIAIVIPAYNEEQHLAALLTELPKKIAGFSVLPIVVNDGSADQTAAIAQQVPGVRVVSHRTNLGKGAAAKTGCDAAHHLGAEIIVLMDGDGQHRAEDVVRLVTPLLKNDTSATPPVQDGLVVGTRCIGGSMPYAMRVGNRTLNTLSRLLFHITSTDTQSGFRAFTRTVYPKIRWISPHYAMETEMLILAATNRVTLSEVSIPTVYHDNYKGTTPADGLRILITLLKWRLFWHREMRTVNALVTDLVEDMLPEGGVSRNLSI